MRQNNAPERACEGILKGNYGGLRGK